LAADYSGRGIATLDTVLGFLRANLSWFLPHRVLDCFAGVGWFLEQHLDVSPPAVIRILLVACMLLLWLVTFWRHPDFRLIPLVVAGVGLILITRYNGGASRYWTAAYPFMTMVMLRAAPWLVAPPGNRWLSRGLLAAGVAVALGAASLLALDHGRRLPQTGPSWQAFVRVGEEGRRSLPADTAVLAHNPHTFQLVSARYRTVTSAELEEAVSGRITEPVVCVLVPQPAAYEHHRRDYVESVAGVRMRAHTLTDVLTPVIEDTYYVVGCVDPATAGSPGL
jgi:hypothetical protein